MSLHQNHKMRIWSFWKQKPVSWGRQCPEAGPRAEWVQRVPEAQTFAQSSDGNEEMTQEYEVKATAKSKCPPVFAHTLSSPAILPGGSIQTMGFKSSQTLSPFLNYYFFCELFRPRFHAFGLSMESSGDVSPNVSPTGRWLNPTLCSSVEERWKAGVSQRCDVYIQFRKVRGKNPLCYYLQCHHTEATDIKFPGCWLLCDPEDETCCQKEVFLSAGGGRDLSVFSLGLSSQVWIWTSASWSPIHQLPLCTAVLLLYNPHADVSQIFLISNVSFSLASRCSS